MLISIIVPIYNMQKYLRKCLDTLIKQTYDKLEIILVDDGSTDSSGVICDEYLLKDNRIKVIHKENAGVSDARNVGIAIAKGEYIGFVDPDDYIELNMYEKLLYLIKNNNCDIAICGYVIEDENGNSVRNLDKEIKNIILNSEKAMKLLINNGNFGSYPWDKLYKRNLFNNIKYPIGKIYEDADTTYKLIHKCKKIIYNSEPLYHYIKRKNSLSHNFSLKMMYRLEIDKNFTEFIIKYYPDLYEDVKPIWYRTNIQLLKSMFISSSCDLKIYKELVRNISNKMIYILKENKLISLQEKLLAISAFLSINMTRNIIRVLLDLQKHYDANLR